MSRELLAFVLSRTVLYAAFYMLRFYTPGLVGGGGAGGAKICLRAVVSMDMMGWSVAGVADLNMLRISCRRISCNSCCTTSRTTCARSGICDSPDKRGSAANVSSDAVEAGLCDGFL